MLGELQVTHSRLDGCSTTDLIRHDDERGSFSEVFRDDWPLQHRPVQWNVMRSAGGVLRGVHVHPAHDDYLVLIGGRATVGLCDLRRGSPSFGRSDMVELDASCLVGLFIPHGIAHGFCFTEPSILLYSVTHFFNPDDELGCHWADPDLGITWPIDDPTLSSRDESAGSLAELMLAFDGPGSH